MTELCLKGNITFSFFFFILVTKAVGEFFFLNTLVVDFISSPSLTLPRALPASHPPACHCCLHRGHEMGRIREDVVAAAPHRRTAVSAAGQRD